MKMRPEEGIFAMRRLPDAEFDIMNEVWRMDPPVTTHMLMETIGTEKCWKAPSLITLMNRLIERGFLRSEKTGKERRYYPLVDKSEYLRYETQNFLDRVHGGSVNSFFEALGDTISAENKEALAKWLAK